MSNHILITTFLLLTATVSAAAQNRPLRIAHDFCYPYAGADGYETRCEIRISGGQGETVGLMEAIQPSWSPDGRRLLGVNSDILLFDLAAGTAVNLTNWGAWYGTPRWSPDGTRIAFATERNGKVELYTMNADGTAQTRLTEALLADGGFAWSPDGAVIAFGAVIGGQSDLFVVRPDGTNRTRLTTNAGVNAGTSAPEPGAPSWSADGARIAFDCVNDICTVNADGSGLARLTTEPTGSFGAVFSPVDGRIAFLRGQAGDLGLAVMDASGTVTRIIPDVRVKRPAWSPGGERLIVQVPQSGSDCPADGSCVQNDTIYTVESDGTGMSLIEAGQNPQWAPAPAGQPFATFIQTCAGSTCEFDARGSFDDGGVIASYAWTFGDGTVTSTPWLSHGYAQGGTYYVTLTVTDDSGSRDIAVKKVFANSLPVASFTVTCSGPTCTFDGSASHDPDGSITAHTWIFGDGSAAEGTMATHVYPSGTFTATLFVSDNSGSGGSTTREITATNAPPVASFTVSCTDLKCNYDARASTDDGGTISGYRIDPGDGTPATTFSNEPLSAHTYAAPGTYTATLTVVDSGGESSTTSRTVTVVSPPMHIGDLDGTRYVYPQSWDLYVSVQVHRQTHEPPPSGAVVSGTWNDGTSASCTADGNGQCWIGRAGLAKKVASVTFTITSVIHPTYVYKAAGNHDPEADSNGTIIKIVRQ